ncbi:hypothetical protein [Rhizobium sp. RAF56]|uniref:hypothetical protein n=1 Tax=Rhizobium sp. RAF56 TaxID=3233062 RepID=UPI003F9D033F
MSKHFADIPRSQSRLPNPLQPEAPEVPKPEADAEPKSPAPQTDTSPASQKNEYERGAQAGKDKEPGEQPKTGEERPSKSFEHGYLDAQKVRSDSKRPS